MTHHGLRTAVKVACFVCPAATAAGLWHGRPVDSAEALLLLAVLYGFLALPYGLAFRVAHRDPCSRWGLVALLATLLVVGAVTTFGGWLIGTPVGAGGSGL